MNKITNFEEHYFKKYNYQSAIGYIEVKPRLGSWACLKTSAMDLCGGFGIPVAQKLERGLWRNTCIYGSVDDVGGSCGGYEYSVSE